MRSKEMRVSEKGIRLIKKYEGLMRVTYRCPSGVFTIGYGHTKDVRKGDVITPQQAEIFLLEDVSYIEDTVNSLVVVPLTQNQFDALISFTYNVGSGNFANSTLLKILNKADGYMNLRGIDNGIIDISKYEAAADQFLRWNKVGKTILAGLTRRRKEEKRLFLC